MVETLRELFVLSRLTELAVVLGGMLWMLHENLSEKNRKLEDKLAMQDQAIAALMGANAQALHVLPDHQKTAQLQEENNQLREAFYSLQNQYLALAPTLMAVAEIKAQEALDTVEEDC